MSNKGNVSTGKQAALERYQQLVDKISPKSALGQGCVRAFLVGGIICAIGQGLTDVGFFALKLTSANAANFASITLIFLTALLTGIGVFDKLGQYAGAGTVVPITGFANAMVSPAMEFTPEGYILGTGVKLFTIAGPVIVYGVSASVIVGVLYYFIRW